MARIVEPSSEILVSDYLKCGGKSKGLIWLAKSEFLVPEFLTLVDFQKNTSKSDLVKNLQEILDFKKYPWLTNKVAVRSSATFEDGKSLSFAGIFDSVLNVTGFEELTQGILKVLESQSSERAQKYFQEHKINTEQSKMSVVIQRMLKPEWSGVAFACNPITGNNQQLWISVVPGIGEALVSGQVDALEYLVSEKNEILTQNEKAKDVLSQLHFLTELQQIIKKISDLKSSPQDIEWAFAENKLWILQTRPVTSHVLKKNSTFVFDNSNIQESYCGVTTPLTYTFASYGYHQVYDELMRLMNMSGSAIRQAEWRHRHLLGFVFGRVYYNINYWYEGLLYLPNFGRRKSEMEEMMGIEEPVDFIHNLEVSSIEKIKRLPQMLWLLAMMIYRFSKMDQLTKEFDEWFWKLYRYARLEKLYTLSDEELLYKLRDFQSRSLEKWGIPVLNDFLVMIQMGKIRRLIEISKLDFDVKSLMYQSDAELESIKPTLELHRLCQVIAKNENLLKFFQSQSRDCNLENIEILSPLIFKQIKIYIDLYGDRVMGELKLETITMKQNPQILLNLIQQYLNSNLHKKESVFSSAHKSQSLQSLPIKIRKSILKLQKAIAARELMRFHRTRSFGANRQMYLALGERWTKKNILKQKDDIFYLTRDEIFDFGFGRAVTQNLQALTQLRKDEAKYNETKQVDSQIKLYFPVGRGDQQEKEKITHITSDTYKGLGCSAGVVEGEVIFLKNHDEIQNISGKILLAERTDPGWTPLFALVKGIIVEKGSILSHSAVIAREVGIPAVVGIRKISSILKTGDQIRLDGSTGTIEILNQHNRGTK
jgi:pyruvate,water dikinase